MSHCNLTNWSQTSCHTGSQLGSLGGKRWGVKAGLEAAAKPCSVPKAANRTAQALCQERNLISLLTNETKMWLEVPRFGGMSNFPIINHPNQIVFISLHYLAAFLWQTIWAGFCFSPMPTTDVICGLWQRDAGVKRGWTGHLCSKNLAKTMSVIIS